MSCFFNLNVFFEHIHASSSFLDDNNYMWGTKFTCISRGACLCIWAVLFTSELVDFHVPRRADIKGSRAMRRGRGADSVEFRPSGPVEADVRWRCQCNLYWLRCSTHRRNHIADSKHLDKVRRPNVETSDAGAKKLKSWARLG